MPSIRNESSDSESAHLTIPLDAPSWVTMWAYRQVRRQGWHTVSPDEYYEERDGLALMKIKAGPAPVYEILRMPITTTHRGVIESLSVGRRTN